MKEEKARVIAQLQADWQAVKDLMDSVPRSRLLEPGVLDDWSAKDLMGHIATWEEVGIDRVRKLRAGEEIVRPYPDINAFNARESARKSDLSLEEIEGQFVDTHSRLVEALENLPDRFFLPQPQPPQTAAALTLRHCKQHAEDLRKWLKSIENSRP